MSNGDWSKVAQRVAGQSLISSSLNTGINGGSFKDNFTTALLANIGGQLHAEGANLIGDHGRVLGGAGKALSHAVVAGVAAEIGGGDAKGAAAGALAAELAGAVPGIATVNQSTTGIKWGQGISQQGMPWENYVGTQLPADARLPKNFKTFDYYNPISRTAISVKTLDTTTAGRVANPR
ncbi:Possible hemagglutinin (DUF637) [Yersinia thracica]|uniref:Possible hemagglutinin (DUF637) n=1 Tax=Yersinia thracica TaxID=2890319 RepID=A0A0T9PHK4_9GAMM|nr:Possible hemagglutinin (DUF637) [Yersinia thracica]